MFLFLKKTISCIVLMDIYQISKTTLLLAIIQNQKMSPFETESNFIKFKMSKNTFLTRFIVLRRLSF